jgi:mRNA interferase MazF
VVRQGDIIKTDFSPTSGHEQSGYRPALVVSNETFNQATNQTYVCPITNTDRNSGLHIKLNETATTGYIMCDQLRSVDLNNRPYRVIEHIDQATFESVAFVIRASIQVLENW